jgi:hypothetical protein
VDLGPVDHRALVAAASGKIADLLTSGKAGLQTPLPAHKAGGKRTAQAAGQDFGPRRVGTDFPRIHWELR